MSKKKNKKQFKHKGFNESMQPTMEACALAMEKFIAEALAEHKNKKKKGKK